MLKEAEKPEDPPSSKVEFEKGDVVKINEGAFENFEGTVDSIDPERGVVRVIVTIFGRRTPLEIESWQDRKSTRLNSSNTVRSYAVFCWKKKKNKQL